ncbi:hypothetical protein QZM46_29990 [Burkholderia vietnamiensis]|uniref:hypothetical protein n=1 Tax=Burkholderia vietnamiensis TaxID=60552 RepID=UPI00264B95DA|nr:hypothetical protein [Burkholderia vietnamiensis]MDN7555546.1 hypothetical protein [Burkholderia vietnamiensis]HDR9095095.1 hypothetical protein [Burkholderia vietnamiensis]
MTNRAEVDAALQEAKEVASRLKASLPSSVDAAQQGIMFKSLFYALVVREALLHRIVALADDAFALRDASRSLSAAIIARSMLETMSILGYLRSVFEKFEATGDEKVLFDRIAKAVVGARNMQDEAPTAVHVLKAIEETEQRIGVPGLMAVYESLCEFTHPNWSGVLGSFGEHEHAHRVVFGTPPRAIPPVEVHLAIILTTFEQFYTWLGEAICTANARLEQNRQREGSSSSTSSRSFSQKSP